MSIKQTYSCDAMGCSEKTSEPAEGRGWAHLQVSLFLPQGQIRTASSFSVLDGHLCPSHVGKIRELFFTLADPVSGDSVCNTAEQIEIERILKDLPDYLDRITRR